MADTKLKNAARYDQQLKDIASKDDASREIQGHLAQYPKGYKILNPGLHSDILKDRFIGCRLGNKWALEPRRDRNNEHELAQHLPILLMSHQV